MERSCKASHRQKNKRLEGTGQNPKKEYPKAGGYRQTGPHDKDSRLEEAREDAQERQEKLVGEHY